MVSVSIIQTQTQDWPCPLRGFFYRRHHQDSFNPRSSREDRQDASHSRVAARHYNDHIWGRRVSDG